MSLRSATVRIFSTSPEFVNSGQVSNLQCENGSDQLQLECRIYPGLEIKDMR